MATTAEKAEKLCTKCGVNPKAGDASDKNPWCQQCRTEYQREWRETLDWRTERRGILRGIRAMRETIKNYFLQYGGRPFMGNEAASIVDGIPGPDVAPEEPELRADPELRAP